MKLTGIIPQIKTDNKIQTKKSEGLVDKIDGALSVTQTDRVEISAGTMDIQKVREVLGQTPSVRSQRVQELKDQIARGEYSVDPYKIADKMLISLLSDHLRGE